MVVSFSDYVMSEVEAIRSFQAVEVKRLGHAVTNNEAATRWIEQGLAANFRKEYKKRSNDG